MTQETSPAVEAATARVKRRLAAMRHDETAVGADLQLLKDTLPQGIWVPYLAEKLGVDEHTVRAFVARFGDSASS